MFYKLKDNVKAEDLLKLGLEQFGEENEKFIYGDGIIVNIKTKDIDIPSYSDDMDEQMEIVDCIYLLTKNNFIE